MPLHERRPKLLALRLDPQCSFSSDDPKTPLRTPLKTPLMTACLPFQSFQKQPMVMTPDTPAFELPMLDIFAPGYKRERSPESGSTSHDEQWTEDEDGILQSQLLKPPSFAKYPPGTLPPAEALDYMTSKVVERRRSTQPWRHSWDATRRRLFDIARMESRKAVGGHRRDKSDSIVPVLTDKRAGGPKRPSLAVLGGQGMSRQQHSMDSLLGDEEQSISEAVRLSGDLQTKALQGAQAVLHRNTALCSPVALDFGSSLPLKKTSAAFAPARPIPRPSLLQRGRSYTGDDLVRESARYSHSRNDSDATTISAASDDDDERSRELVVEIAERDDNATQYHVIESAATPRTTRPLPPPSMHRSVSSPTALPTRRQPAFLQMTSCAAAPAAAPTPVKASSGLLVEHEPITPLHQTKFIPQCALGLGPFIPGDGSASPEDIPSDSPLAGRGHVGSGSPGIAITIDSPESDRSVRRPYDHEDTDNSPTPRLGSSSTIPRIRDTGPLSASSAMANLSLSTPEYTPPSVTSGLPLAGPSHPLAPLAPSSFSSRRGLRPLPLSRSMSELSSVAGQAPPSLSLPTSYSHNSLSSNTLASPPELRTGGALAALSESGRESKRQRGLRPPIGITAGGVESSLRRSKAQGLSVVVPTAMAAESSLRSPFEHKAGFLA